MSQSKNGLAPHVVAAIARWSCLFLLGCGDASAPDPGTPGAGGSGAAGAGGEGAAGAMAGAGGDGGEPSLPACVEAAFFAEPPPSTLVDTPYQASVEVAEIAPCQRTYELSTTAPPPDGGSADARSITEATDHAVLRSGNAMFDALYGLARLEVEENSVDSISDPAFAGGAPKACPAGGCFETGEKWTYVWTRDTAYAVALGLASLDPTRATNSMLFKVSPRRDGSAPMIVQDTGTGGSYPISTDRVTWALGAGALLDVLDGDERAAFAATAYEALRNTVHQDRAVAFDPRDGLYRGEQSFLDWREQSYAAFTATDTVHIGMSKSLSTNVVHLVALELVRDLAAEAGDNAEAATVGDWASALRAAIEERFYLEDAGQFSSFLPTALDPAPTHRYDLLGTSLAVLAGVGSEAQRASAIQSYPVLPKGAPVLWPQQQDVPIYHNRGLWPFVTAFWAKAARSVGNAQAVTMAVRSLMRGSALSLSNMENFEAVTGATYLEEGPTSGPVINSRRQLWSVAGYVSMVHDVLFGIEMHEEGVRFAPYLPVALQEDVLSGVERVALNHLSLRGHSVTVVLTLGERAGASNGAWVADSIAINGEPVSTGLVPWEELPQDALVEIALVPDGRASAVTSIDETDIADYRNVFGPRTPAVTSLGVQGGLMQLGIDVAGEAASDVTIHVYRDGERVAEGLPGSTTQWSDPGSAAHATRSYCYTVETVFASGNASQHAEPVCYWGPGADRIQTWGADAFVAQGGSFVVQYGYPHYQAWGDVGDTLTLEGVQASASGEHYLQLLAGNGWGSFTTGITCGIKMIEVWDGANLVAAGSVMMPHLGTWNAWRSSSLLPVTLNAGTTYTVVVRQDEQAFNMSELAHFEAYAGAGGTDGPTHHVNVAEIKLLRARER